MDGVTGIEGIEGAVGRGFRLGPPGTQCHHPAQVSYRLGFASRCPFATARLPALPTLDAEDLVGVGFCKGAASPLYPVRSFNRIAPNSPMHG